MPDFRRVAAPAGGAGKMCDLGAFLLRMFPPLRHNKLWPVKGADLYP